MNKISLITPCYNAHTTIRETFESIRTQPPPTGFEYVVVDSNSSDGSSEIIATATDIVTKHIREKDQGIYDGMNKGLRAVTGDVIGIINSDDTLTPGALARISQEFEDPALDYVVSDVYTIDKIGARTGIIKAEPQWLSGKINPLGRDWRTKMVFPHPGIYVRRQVYERAGLFDTRYRLCADHDFVARIIRLGFNGKYIHDHPLANFRLGGQSSSNVEACLLEDERIAVTHGLPKILARLIRLRKAYWARRNPLT